MQKKKLGVDAGWTEMMYDICAMLKGRPRETQLIYSQVYAMTDGNVSGDVGDITITGNQLRMSSTTVNRQEFSDKMEDFGVSFEQLISMIELAEHMVGEYVCGKITEDEERAAAHIGRLWSLMNGMVELSHLRNQELETLLKELPYIEAAPEQSAKD